MKVVMSETPLYTRRTIEEHVLLGTSTVQHVRKTWISWLDIPGDLIRAGDVATRAEVYALSRQRPKLGSYLPLSTVHDIIDKGSCRRSHGSQRRCSGLLGSPRHRHVLPSSDTADVS